MTSSVLPKQLMYIDGVATPSSSGAWFESYNPFTGEPWALVGRGTADDAARPVNAAHRALASVPWPKLTASQRGALMRRLGDLIARDAARLAEIEVTYN